MPRAAICLSVQYIDMIEMVISSATLPDEPTAHWARLCLTACRARGVSLECEVRRNMLRCTVGGCGWGRRRLVVQRRSRLYRVHNYSYTLHTTALGCVVCRSMRHSHGHMLISMSHHMAYSILYVTMCIMYRVLYRVHNPVTL